MCNLSRTGTQTKNVAHVSSVVGLQRLKSTESRLVRRDRTGCSRATTKTTTVVEEKKKKRTTRGKKKEQTSPARSITTPMTGGRQCGYTVKRNKRH